MSIKTINPEPIEKSNLAACSAGNSRQYSAIVPMAIANPPNTTRNNAEIPTAPSGSCPMIFSLTNFGTALNKAYAAAGVEIGDKEKGVFVTLSDAEKPNFIEVVNKYIDLEFSIYATEGTASFLKENNIESIIVGRADDESPTSLTIIEEKLISIVINTPTFANEYTDGWKIRRLSHETGVAVVSSVREAEAFLEAFLLQEKVLDDMEAIQNVS